jgi:hypothetical protein
VTITGITTILGNKRVLLEVAIPAKGTEPAKKESHILAEGQREGDIEVLQIDEKTGDVKLNDFGTVMTLNIEKDGPKLASTPPPGIPMPGVPGVPNAVPGVNLPLPSTTGATPGKLSLPTRALRTAAANGTMSGGMGASSYQSTPAPGVIGAPLVAGVPGVSATPTLTPSFPTVQPGTTVRQPEVPMTPEEQAILMEVERERNANNPSFPPLPPTPLTPGQTPGHQTPPTIPPPPR